ncbi:MAG: zinc ribbon domain-containing protein [Pseudomonadota bacterium]
MPIYEYECKKCGAVEEVWQKISDKPLTTCKACKGDVHKVISQSTFHLKGSGWYVTDYANKSSSSDKPAKAKKQDSATANTTTTTKETVPAKSGE